MALADDVAATLRTYTALWDDYRARGFAEAIDPADKENRHVTAATRAHYFEIGADAARLILEALIGVRAPVPARILDFPSGSGRVTRHLRALFPEAEIGACDLYPSHIAFCAETFGAVPILSQEDLAGLDVGQWDVIFCGSLLTHLPEPLFRAAVAFIVRALAPGGIAVMTTEGRGVPHLQANLFRLIDDEAFEVAHARYCATGFGFVDYGARFMARGFDRQSRYGVTLVHPGWLVELICRQHGVRIVSLTEKAWDNHQDVVVIQARHIDR